jgi:hypothetical protein
MLKVDDVEGVVATALSRGAIQVHERHYPYGVQKLTISGRVRR